MLPPTSSPVILIHLNPGSDIGKSVDPSVKWGEARHHPLMLSFPFPVKKSELGASSQNLQVILHTPGIWQTE